MKSFDNEPSLRLEELQAKVGLGGCNTCKYYRISCGCGLNMFDEEPKFTCSKCCHSAEALATIKGSDRCLFYINLDRGHYKAEKYGRPEIVEHIFDERELWAVGTFVKFGIKAGYEVLNISDTCRYVTRGNSCSQEHGKMVILKLSDKFKAEYEALEKKLGLEKK